MGLIQFDQCTYKKRKFSRDLYRGKMIQKHREKKANYKPSTEA